MKLSQVLNKLTGDFELTLYRNDEPICEDEEIHTSEYDPVSWPEYINGYADLKGMNVTGIHLDTNRNYNGAALWISVQ